MAIVVDPLVVRVFLDQPVLVAIYAITIAISVWLFRDARRRGKSVVVAAGWAIGGLLLPALVHFGYLYGRIRDEGSIVGPPLERDEPSKTGEKDESADGAKTEDDGETRNETETNSA